MNRVSRTRLVVAALGGVVLLAGLVGCGRLGEGTGTAESTDLSWPAQALQAVGFASDDLAAAEPVGGATADSGTGTKGAGGVRARHPRLRYVFQHALHGEATVQTDEGTRTVVAQRGKVTAVSDTSITVTSSDGFVLTWVVGARTVVVVNRAKAQLSSVTVGTEVGVAGSRDGSAINARLVVVPKA